MTSLIPYEGAEPYIFISYAHANAPAVNQVMEDLHTRGCRLWYDGGIEVGSEWPEYIASHLAGAAVMIAFVSNAYVRSENCRKELHFALTRRIPVVSVFLENTVLTPGMEMQLGNLFALMKFSMEDDTFYQKLYAAPQLMSVLPADAPVRYKPSEKRRKRVPVDLNTEARRLKRRKGRRVAALLAALSLLIAVFVLALVGHFTGLTERLLLRREQVGLTPLAGSTEAVFQSPVFERVAREYTGVASGAVTVGDLAGLTRLYLCGDTLFFEEPDEAQLTAALEKKGSVSDLSDLRYFIGLQTLSLQNQPLSSLETLPACGIEYLDLSGCRLSTLEGIGRLPRLRELAADGCPLLDLGDLGLCLELRGLHLFDTRVTDFTPLKPLTELASFSVSHSSTGDLHTVLQLSSLTSVTLVDCDLRGSFFRSFDRERSLVSLSLIDCKLDSTANLEDFEGLTTLTLVRSGEELDWSRLSGLPVLKTVTIDGSMEAAVRPALEGTDVEILMLEET